MPPQLERPGRGCVFFTGFSGRDFNPGLPHGCSPDVAVVSGLAGPDLLVALKHLRGGLGQPYSRGRGPIHIRLLHPDIGLRQRRAGGPGGELVLPGPHSWLGEGVLLQPGCFIPFVFPARLLIAGDRSLAKRRTQPVDSWRHRAGVVSLQRIDRAAGGPLREDRSPRRPGQGDVLRCDRSQTEALERTGSAAPMTA